jgi:hypothetical protein
LIDRINTLLAPILTDDTFEMKGLGIFRSPKGKEAVKVLININEAANGDYTTIGIGLPNTGYLRLTDEPQQISEQKIACDAILYRFRAPINYVVAYTEKNKSDVIDHMLALISELKDGKSPRLLVDKEQIEEQENISNNLYRLIRISFNLEFNHVTDGSCPVTIDCPV